MRQIRCLVVIGGLVACAPFKEPTVITGGWIHLGGDPEEERPTKRCQWTGEPGPIAESLACEDLGVPEAAGTFLTLWEATGPGEPWLASWIYSGGLSLCRADASTCLSLELGDPYNFQSATTGDLDGDGLDDLVLGRVLAADSTPLPQRVCWGAASTSELSCEELSTSTDRDGGLAIGDLDGDGRADDLLIGADDHDSWNDLPELCAFGSDRNTECIAWDPAIPEQSSSLASMPAIADLDGDGDDDVLMAFTSAYNMAPVWCESEPGRAVEALCVDPPARPVAVPEFYEESLGVWYPEAPHDLALVDLEGDGDIDLVALSHRGRFYTCLNEGTGSLDCTEGEAVLAKATWSDHLQTADLDGDGDVEVLLPGRSEDNLDELWLCEQTGADWSCSELLDGAGLDDVALLPALVEG